MTSNTIPTAPNSAQHLIVAKKDTIAPGGILIEKGDVAVLLSETQNHATVFFVRIWQQVELAKGEYEAVDMNDLGDDFTKKICNVCHKLKDTTQFEKNQNAKNNRSVRRPSCRDCRKKINGASVSPADRREWKKVKPVKSLFECPICSKRTIAGITSKVVLEHDHRTGKPGGWICDSCNTGLGRFKDDMEILQRAIEFLKTSY